MIHLSVPKLRELRDLLDNYFEVRDNPLKDQKLSAKEIKLVTEYRLRSIEVDLNNMGIEITGKE